MSAADFAAGRLRQKQNLFQRLSELADFDAKPAPMADDAERVLQTDILQPDEKRKRERFIPVTRFALLDRLTKPFLWNPGQAAEARRFFAISIIGGSNSISRSFSISNRRTRRFHPTAIC